MGRQDEDAASARNIQGRVKRYTKEGSWKYDVVMNGFKYNTTDMASSMGLEQLKKADFMNSERRRISRMYDGAFRDMKAVVTSKVKEDRESSWHLYPLKINPDKTSVTRDSLVDELKEQGIMTSVHFIPLYRFSGYRDMFDMSEFPVCESVYNTVFSLPLFVGLSDDEIKYVVDAVRDILENKDSATDEHR